MKNNGSGACLDHLHLETDGSICGVCACHAHGRSQSAVYINSKLVLAGHRFLDGFRTTGSEEKLQRKKLTKK